MDDEKTKPFWTWTHTGEKGEQLCECEGMYYTQFAWDRFLEAYKGKVTPRYAAKKMEPFPGNPPFDYPSYKPDWSSSISNVIEFDFSDLDTDPMIQRKP